MKYPGKYARMRHVRAFFAALPDGTVATTEAISAAVGVPASALRGTLRRMVAHGWLTMPTRATWQATDALRVEVVAYVEGAVRRLLEQGPTTIGTVVRETGVSKQAAHRVLVALERDGYVERHRLPGNGKGGMPRIACVLLRPFGPWQARPRLDTPHGTARPFIVPHQPDLDDDWTPPARYIGGTRAVILGLRRAA